MFNSLSDRLGGIFDRLGKRGALNESDVEGVLREVRIALLEADVALPVAKQFINDVKPRAIGQEVLRSVKPDQQVIKIVHDTLVETLGEVSEGLQLAATPPVPVLMVGLQGSGNTTSTGKISKMLRDKDKKKVLMASLDTRRPAAQEQLRFIGEQLDIPTLPIIEGQEPVAIAERALKTARLEGYDVVMLDSAGRLSIDEELMAEIKAVRDATNPAETLLVADALTGQDAVNIAQKFDEAVGISGIMLTRVDGDSRGGAALSMRAVTGKPIKLLGVGEKLDAIEAFHPDRVAGRILGMGDVVSLVERAAEVIEQQDAEKMIAKLEKGQFDLQDLADQLLQMKKMGGVGGLMGMMPGIGKLKKQMDEANIDDKQIDRQIAIVRSMTTKERRYPKLLNASRKRRIASGSGVEVQEINRLLKQHQQMQGMMKKVKKMAKKGGMPGMPGMGGLGGMIPGMGGGKLPKGMSQADLEAMAKEMGAGGGGKGDLGKLLGGGGKLPPGFPGKLPPGFGGN